MEPVQFRDPPRREQQPKTWATTGTGGTRTPNVISSLHLEAVDLEKHNIRLQEKYRSMREKEARFELVHVEDAEVVIVAYGTSSRIARNAISDLREQGIRAGMIRPITLWPFPDRAFDALPDSLRAVLTVELSCGQMIDDVRLAVNGRFPVRFFGRTGGMVFSQQDIADACSNVLKEVG
jgi:2-oxoglutarate/2-oxoacid ferredoxin oxidoreductase subunit alpha